MKFSFKDRFKNYFEGKDFSKSDHPLNLNILLLRLSGTPLPATGKENVSFRILVVCTLQASF